MHFECDGYRYLASDCFGVTSRKSRPFQHSSYRAINYSFVGHNLKCLICYCPALFDRSRSIESGRALLPRLIDIEADC